MVYINLFIEFFKIGIFSYGGGLAMLPLLQDTAISRGWITASQFADLIAISESTPGPIAINMATFIGFNSGGVFGSIIASLAVVLPAFILALILAKFLQHFNKHPMVQSVLIGVKAAVIGLVCTAVLQVALVSLYQSGYGQLLTFYKDLDYKAIILFIIMLLGVIKYRKNPIIYISIAGIIGAIIW
ncbi:chromate transporter [Natranaerovirga hydrolytica]|uniref:Chromate transporter n=1 Tax=Natranaerovirga hydrolytica TaxID=680378 RepID=A0A4R1MEI8_9FIRM|nr:chromate transporter [Natranaerovirga hydrolytica]TCK90635.1 chromate transporter [Natranaerovirga hydrolytica]